MATLGGRYPAHGIHDEADRMEHAVSPPVLDAIDKCFGHPMSHPRGDPITGSREQVKQASLAPLAFVEIGTSVRVARVLDQSEDSLRFLKANGLAVGSFASVDGTEPGAGIVWGTNAERERVSMSI